MSTLYSIGGVLKFFFKKALESPWEKEEVCKTHARTHTHTHTRARAHTHTHTSSDMLLRPIYDRQLASQKGFGNMHLHRFRSIELAEHGHFPDRSTHIHMDIY